MAEAVYLLCAITSIACAIMLLRGYVRSRARFLLWCAACFVCLALNNGVLFVDKVVYPDEVLRYAGLSFTVWRGLTAFVGVSLLLFGLIWDTNDA